jgi:hypothetical protein
MMENWHGAAAVRFAARNHDVRARAALHELPGIALEIRALLIHHLLGRGVRAWIPPRLPLHTRFNATTPIDDLSAVPVFKSISRIEPLRRLECGVADHEVDGAAMIAS